MATFDQLAPEQRAIIELVVQRGRSYQSLADVLEIAPARVRELARAALAELAPVTVERVDPEWRGQLADYLLAQQTGPEATATRGHLKRSESARVWALSLLDSLDSLYGAAERPEIPDGVDGAGRQQRERDRPRRGVGLAAPPPEPDPQRRGAGAPRRRVDEEPAPPSDPERGEHARRGLRVRRAEPDPEHGGVPAPAARAPVPAPATKPPPRAARMPRRRHLLGALAAAAVAAAVVVGVLALTGAFGGTSKSKARATATSRAATRTQVVGELPLKPAGSDKTAQGIAVIAQRGAQRQLIVQAKMATTPKGYAYEVWLYNSPTDVYSLGAQVTDQQGNYQGAGPLPANYQRFKNIDISLEKIGRSTAHSGPSVLRGALAALQQPPAQGSSPAQTAP